MAIQGLDLPGIFRAVAEQRAAKQSEGMNALRMLQAQREAETYDRQQNALSRLNDPGLSDTDKRGLIGSAFPEIAAKALFRDPSDRYKVAGDRVWDLQADGGPRALGEEPGYTDLYGNPVGGMSAPQAPRPTLAPGGHGPVPMPDLARRVMMAESGGDPNAVSPKGAVGTMQTMPGTLRDPGFGVQPARDNSPAEQERVGKDYLQAMLKEFGNERDALIAYNWGPDNAMKWLAAGGDVSKLPAETRNYVAKILGNGQPAPQAQPQSRPTGPVPMMRNGKIVPGWGVDANGNPVPLSASSTTVNVDTKGDTKEAEGIGAARAKEFETVMERANGAQDSINQVRLARTIADTDPAGKELPSVLQSKAGNIVTALGFDPESPMIKNMLGRVSDGQTFNGVMMNLVLSKQTQQVGPQTDKDAENIKATLASLGNTPQAREFLLRTTEALAQRDVDKRSFYEAHLERTGSLKGVNQAWNKHVNSIPLFGVNPTSKKPVFWQEFNEAVRAANPDASDEDIMGLWRQKYGRAR